MQHRNLLPEPGGKLAQHLRGQPDLRHEHNGAFALLKYVRDQLQIHLRLAAARHTEQQRGTRCIFIHQGCHAVIRLLLCGRQNRLGGAGHIGKVRRAQHFLVLHTQDALFRHIAQGGFAYAGHVDQLLPAHRAAV